MKRRLKMRLLTNKEKKFYEEELKILHSGCDIEEIHDKADDLLCEILRKMGYYKIPKLFNKLEKWY